VARPDSFPSRGILDLVARREIDRRVEGDVDHILADEDQVTPHRKIVDRTPKVGGVDDGGRFGGEAGEILRDRQPGNVDVGGQKGLQRDRRGKLAGADEAARNVIDLLMHRLEEMRRFEEVGNPIERFVVDQNGAQQGLLRLDIVRGGPVGTRGFLRRLA
jgi:hypothetical protein